MNSVLVACTRVTVVLLISCLATCAAGSCLSYGHSCWGAHGKRSGTSNDGQWFLSKLAPDNSWKPRRTILPLESSALRHLNLNENSLLEGAEAAALDLLSEGGDYSEDDEDNPAGAGVGESGALGGGRTRGLGKEKPPVILMEQSPARLYKLLSQARKLEMNNPRAL